MPKTQIWCTDTHAKLNWVHNIIILIETCEFFLHQSIEKKGCFYVDSLNYSQFMFHSPLFLIFLSLPLSLSFEKLLSAFFVMFLKFGRFPQ